VNVEKAIKSIEGIESVTADPHSGEVIIAGQEIDLEKVKLKVEDIGYDYKGVWKR
jgi:copper chaperone CopZ